MNRLKLNIIIPPIILLLGITGFSFFFNDEFVKVVTSANNWILRYFGWLFSWSTFLFLVILVFVYLSPFAKLRIGGQHAQPFLTKWQWFSISICTTIATGILFWGPAEPLFHFHNPPEQLGYEAMSKEAENFALTTVIFHWTLSPYGIYTITGLLFAIVFYNLKKPFSLSSLLYPIFGEKIYGKWGQLIDIVSLFSLVAGMAASLGAGILTMVGGLDQVLGIEKSIWVVILVSLSIIIAFILSAVSGLMRGIRFFSDLNFKSYLLLTLFIIVTGPTLFIFKSIIPVLWEYFTGFVQRSVNIPAHIESNWLNSWTYFYWAIWFAWTPITAMFLGRLAKGYTVRQYINMNLLWPSVFGAFWMFVFSNSSIFYDIESNGGLHTLLEENGLENVIYYILDQLPFGGLVSIIFLVIVFISYVTAADSNTTAMSNISTKGVTADHPESPLLPKLIWGILIGVVAVVMILSAGVKGVKMTSVLGGFPALFIIILVAAGLIRMMIQKDRFNL